MINVSLIPARGGSKGIPHKNITILKGRPLIKYVIDASLQSNVCDTWVSTDDENIAKIATECGSKVLIRPDEISRDNSPTEECIKHFLENINCDHVTLIQPTSPMVSSLDINLGLNMISSGQYDSLFSAVKMNDLLIWDHNLNPLNYNYRYRGNRQSRKEHIYIETGGIYMFGAENFFHYNNRLFGRIGVIPVPFWRSFEIDEIVDMYNVEKLL